MALRAAQQKALHRNLPVAAAVAVVTCGRTDDARFSAMRETGLEMDDFLITCPWRFEQVMDAEFWPSAPEITSMHPSTGK